MMAPLRRGPDSWHERAGAHTGGITDARGLSDSFAVRLARKGVPLSATVDAQQDRPGREAVCGFAVGQRSAAAVGPSAVPMRIECRAWQARRGRGARARTALGPAGPREEGAGDASGNAVAPHAVRRTNTLPRQRTRACGENNQHKQEQYPSRGRKLRPRTMLSD